MKKLVLIVSILTIAPIVADTCLETTKDCTARAKCSELAGKTAAQIAKMQLTGGKTDTLGQIAAFGSQVKPVVDGVTNFVNKTMPSFKQIPGIASDTVNCAHGKTTDQIAKSCSQLTKDRLSKANLPMPPVTPGDDKESRYAFAMYNFKSILTQLGDGFFAKVEGQKLSGGGLLYSFMTFLANIQPQHAVLCDAKNRIADIRWDLAALGNAVKYLGDGLKYASEQNKMKAEAKAAKEADPFAPDPINMEEAPAGDTTSSLD